MTEDYPTVDEIKGWVPRSNRPETQTFRRIRVDAARDRRSLLRPLAERDELAKPSPTARFAASFMNISRRYYEPIEFS